MPVRKVPKNYIHITGIVSSSKANGEARFEGGLEFDDLRLLTFDRNVAQFEVQPKRVPWRDQSGRERIYTPDSRVRLIDDTEKRIIREIKPRATLKKEWPELKARFRAAIRSAQEEGSRFKLVTDREIRTQYLESVRFLLPAARRGADPEMRRTVLEALRGATESTPRQLMCNLTTDPWKQAEILPVLWYLIGTFQVAADLDKPLTMDMKISLP